MGEVAALKKTKAEDRAVAAIGMVTEIALPGGKSIQFSTYVDRDDDASVLDGVLDKVMTAGARQQHIHAIVEQKEKIIGCEREIENARRMLTEAERRHQAERISRETQNAELQTEIGRIVEVDQLSFEGSGRRGAYKPSAEANEKMRPLRSAVDRNHSDQKEQDRVRDDAVKSAENVILTMKSHIDWHRSEIARHEAALAE